MKTSVSLFLILAFCFSTSFAEISDYTISGQVTSFDSKEVVIQSRDQLITVPRKLIGESPVQSHEEIKLRLTKKEFSLLKTKTIKSQEHSKK